MNSLRFTGRLLHRAAHGAWHYRITIVTAILAGGMVLLFARSEDTNSRVLRVTDALQQQVTEAKNLQAALEEEAHARTSQSCLDSKKVRDGTIKLWGDVLDFLTAKNPDGTPHPTPPIDGLRKIVADSYPPVTCPDQGAIVIPQPATSVP